jgi:hypothetical protein
MEVIGMALAALAVGYWAGARFVKASMLKSLERPTARWEEERQQYLTIVRR